MLHDVKNKASVKRFSYKKSFPIEESSGHVKNPLSMEKKVILTEAKFLIRGFLYQATLLSNTKLEARKQIWFILVPFLLQTKNPPYFWQLLLSLPYAEEKTDMVKQCAGIKFTKLLDWRKQHRC